MAKKKGETKEDVYDRDVYPLMKQVIAICKEHKIACFATFHTPNDEDPDLACTTALLAPEYTPPEEFMEAFRYLRQNPVALAITITERRSDV